jgi:3-hydroxyacyl-CoA dehydrogenase
MSEVVSYQRRGRVGIVTIDNPPVNALSLAVRSGLVEAFAQAGSDDQTEAIVLCCAGPTFIAGADISEFGRPLQPPHLPDVIEGLEDVGTLTVAAIHGTAFGGGLETAMGCDYRCAVPSAKVGQPEVKLGIIPGAGGTQRLPRLVGVPAALEMVVYGNPVNAVTAQSFGLIDEIVEGDLLEGAIAYADRLLNEGASKRKTRQLEVDPASAPPGFFDEFRKKIAKKARGYHAPEACVRAVEAALELPFAEGMRREAELFMECMRNPQAAALQYVFFSERLTSKIPGISKETPLRPITTVGVVGAGTMGGGIAMVCSNAGIPVTLVEVERGALDRGIAIIEKNYSRSVASGRFTEEKARELMSRITGSLDRSDLAGVDLVVEAVFEDMGLKKEVFGKLDAICKQGAILATNTSTLDVNEIAAATARQQDVIGLHFFSPANVMRLLEIVRGARTADDVLATCLKLSKTIRKVGVVSGVCDGFIGNRMLAGYLNEAGSMLIEGASPAQVDRALFDFGMPMGPFAMSDLAGIDVGYLVRRERGIEPESDMASAVGDRMYAMGRYGQKTGAGFYRYEEGSRTPTPDPVVDSVIEEMAEKFGVQRRELADDEVVRRCIYPLINEAARILAEGIALRPSDIDMVWINGYGFPPYRGGPMHYADAVGVKRIHDTLVEYQQRYGDRWQPAPLLVRLAGKDGTFAGL